MERLRRSRIYLPGNRPRMIQKGPGLGADAVILDLEDSVSPEQKDAARLLVSRAIKMINFGLSEVMVRINPIRHGGLLDLAAVLASGPDAVVVPKCESKVDVQVVENTIKEANLPKQIGILPMIETAKGILNAYEVACASPMVDAITFGGEDFTQDIGATRTKSGKEIFWGRSMVVFAAEKARNKGSGVAVVKGKMIDKPIIQRAEKMIRYAERLCVAVPAPTI